MDLVRRKLLLVTIGTYRVKIIKRQHDECPVKFLVYITGQTYILSKKKNYSHFSQVTCAVHSSLQTINGTEHA